MAPYCTPDDLAGKLPRKRLVELVSDYPRAAWEDQDVQQALVEIIAQAQDQVDATVGLVGTVPVDPVTKQVKGLTVDLALCQALLRRPPMADGWADILKNAHATLRGIARGDIALQRDQQSAQEPPPMDRGISVETDAPRWNNGFWGKFR